MNPLPSSVVIRADEAKKQMSARIERAGLLLLALFILAGVIYSALLAPVARFADEQEYLNLSDHLVHGPGYSMDGVSLTASRPPGYAFFLAAVRLLGGDFFGFRMAQFILLGATVILVSRLCSERRAVGALLLVTGLVGCYPVLFYTSATLYPQTVAGFLFILSLSLILATPRRMVIDICAGLSFGALILVAPTFLFTMGVVLGSAFVLRIVRLREVAVTILAASIVVGAWTARNAVCFDRFVPVATNSGLNLLEGNNANATADAAANVGMRPYYVQAGNLHLDEFETDRFYRNAALEWIGSHPGQAFLLYLEKVANFFNFRNVYLAHNQAEISPWKQVALAVGYLFLLGLLGWRLVEVKRYPLTAREKLFLAVYVLSAFTSAIFFTRIRHRLPYDYLIIAVIALHLSRRIESWMTASRGNPSSDRPA